MLTRGASVVAAVVGLIAGAAGAQTTFLTPQRGHNFMGTPARLPSRSLGIGGAPLKLQGAVDITPARPTPYGGGYGGYGGYRGYTGYHGAGYGGGYAPDGVAPSDGPGSLGGYFDGGSLSLRGQIRSGDMRLAMSLGSDPTGMGRRHRPDRPDGPDRPDRPDRPDGKPPHVKPRPPYYPGYPYFPYWYYSSFRYPWYGYDYPRYPIDGALVVYQVQQPATTPAPAPAPEPAEELTDPQRAALLLAAGDVDGSISLLRSYLDSSPDDAEAMRVLALALLQDDQVREATALMAFAYESNRSLAHQPLGEWNVRGGSRALREAVRRSVGFAHAEDSASAWLTVAVLMQAEGRDERALAMLERAWKAGLDERVHEAMLAALGG